MSENPDFAAEALRIADAEIDRAVKEFVSGAE